MLFRNALRLLIENFKSVYKILLYKLVVTLIFVALSTALVLPLIREVMESAPMDAFIDGLKAFFAAFLDFDEGAMTVAKEGLLQTGKDVYALLTTTNTLLLCSIVFGVAYLLKRFLDAICYFTIGVALNEKMTSFADTPFFASMIANLGKSSLYALIYVPVAFLIDVVNACIVFLLIANMNILIALFISITLIVLVQAAKLTLTGLWMPAYTDSKSLKASLLCATKAERKQHWKMFATYVASVYVVIIVNVVSAVATVGSALILTLPMSFFLFICLQFVYYYTIKGKNYFLTYNKIASNPHHGDEEHIFDYIDETQLPVITPMQNEMEEINVEN